MVRATNSTRVRRARGGLNGLRRVVKGRLRRQEGLAKAIFLVYQPVQLASRPQGPTSQRRKTPGIPIGFLNGVGTTLSGATDLFCENQSNFTKFDFRQE